ncbi:glycosyltransferase family 2 protein [Niabella sp. W65]|nr:glycosyltransferase family 2 protein [Niabella sp. W65]MCH7363277.1 glycosyltransferase family 2 protein [Niabella sp. W65]ULT39205.1 glycosyltransferase family 2 protein [Niabella sp. I65]
MMKRLLIVIPSYNEEAALPKLLNELKTTAFLNSFIVVPLVVNDCSRDRTESVAKDCGETVISLVNNLGIGGAVQAGIKYAKRNQFDYVLQMDGDGQHPG